MVHEHIGKIVRKEDSHKGDYGKVFVIAGSRGMTGAAFLCGQAALLSGSGLVTNGVPHSLNRIMEVKFTEVMTLPLPATKNEGLSLKSKNKILEFSDKCDAIAIGPGLGREQETQELVKALVKQIEKPMVIDADAINAFDGQMDLLTKRSARTVITPHPGEMARLLRKEISEVQNNRVEIAKSVAEISGVVVCLKGHRTVVADPDGKIYINETGNSGMASGGTGDVLTGMIASFLGQGLDDFSAAVSAVYLHGMAGDLAAEKTGLFSLTATDILKNISSAFDKAGI
ncbi:MAG: NAD(P)H-hydrate dehydratase [Candidatus Omnitrophota bacterium]